MSEAVSYRPRNDLVVCRIKYRDKVGGLHVSQRSAEAKDYFVVAVGPKVEGLAAGDQVLIGGEQNKDWALLPGSRDLFCTREDNVLLVVEKKVQTGS